jgi:hypothetical protein
LKPLDALYERRSQIFPAAYKPMAVGGEELI